MRSAEMEVIRDINHGTTLHDIARSEDLRAESNIQPITKMIRENVGHPSTPQET